MIATETAVGTSTGAAVGTPSYRAMSICLQDLQELPIEVRPDSVKICFGNTPAYTIHVDEGVEAPNPEFRSTPKVLAGDLTVYFEYQIYTDTPESDTRLLSQVVFQRDGQGRVVTDKLLDIFSFTPVLV